MHLFLLALLASARADDVCAVDRTGLLVVDAPFDDVLGVEIDGVPVALAERAGGRTVAEGPHHIAIVVDAEKKFEAYVDVAACARVERLLDVRAGRWSNEPAPAPKKSTRALLEVILGPKVTARLDGSPLLAGRQELDRGDHTLDVDRTPCVQHFRVSVDGAEGLRLEIAPSGVVLLGSTREVGLAKPLPTLGSTCDIDVGEKW